MKIRADEDEGNVRLYIVDDEGREIDSYWVWRRSILFWIPFEVRLRWAYGWYKGRKRCLEEEERTRSITEAIAQRINAGEWERSESDLPLPSSKVTL